MIEQHGVRFLLTGSSARSLRRKGVSLLDGRARSRALHPFTRAELGAHFDLYRALEHGLLPPIYFSDAPGEDLAAYAGDYLKDEVAAEAVVRNVGAFSRSLTAAAPAVTGTRKHKAVSTSKYYLLDIGLARHLQGRRGLAPGTPEYGEAFESFIH